MIRLSKCFVSKAEKNIVAKVFSEEHFGMGSYVDVFEKKLKNFFGREVVTVINGTSALLLGLQALGVKRGDEVLVQSMTYLSSFQAISALGAKPIPCDINEDFTISLEDAQKKISKKTKAIMPVHYAGDPGELDQIYKFAKKNNLRVIEDAAHAFGSIYKEKLLGSIGDIVCFSFDGIKNITCGEGGCIVSSDKEIINNIKDSRLLGIEKDSENRIQGRRSWNFDVKTQGWRAHLSNINAAIGIEQLKKFKKIKSLRQDLAKHYDKKIKLVEGFRSINRNYRDIVPHIYPIILDNEKNRDELRKYLAKNDIETGIHYFPNHLLTLYGKGKYKLKKTEEIYPRILTLPLHPSLTKKDINFVVQKINIFFNEASK